MSDDASRTAARYPSLASPAASSAPATPSAAPASSDAAKLAARYPSHSQGAAPAAAAKPGAATSTPGTQAERDAKRYPSHQAPTSPAASPATQSERDAKRYPSHQAPTSPAAPPATQAERTEAERLAKRYPSLAKEPVQAQAQAIGEVPEGFDAKDPVFMDFQKVAGELGLDKAKAGQMLELHQRAVAAQSKAWDAQLDTWEKAIQSDPAFEQTRTDAMTAIRELGTPELEKLAADPMYGSNPELVRFFAAVGRRLSGDR
jgi:hypothetical protein